MTTKKQLCFTICSVFFTLTTSLLGQQTALIPDTIEVTEEGITAGSICLYSEKGNSSDTSFKFGEHLSLDFIGLDGFTSINDSIYPNVDIILLSKKGDTIINAPSILGIEKEGIKTRDINISLFEYYPILMRYGIHSGESYILSSTLRDIKSKKTLKINVDIEVTQNVNPLFDLTKKGLTYTDFYITSYNNNRVVSGNKVRTKEVLLIHLKDLEGFVTKDDKASFDLDFKLTEAAGEPIFKLQKQLSASCKDGKTIERQIDIPFKLGDIKDFKPNTTLIFNLKISDRNSDHFIDLNTEFYVQED